MKNTKKHIDMIVSEIKKERQQYAIDGVGDNGQQLIDGLMVMILDDTIGYGVARYATKKLLEFLELPEYWSKMRQISLEILEYNKNSGA